MVTYLNVDVIVVVSLVLVARRIEFVAQVLHLLPGQPHAERGLNLNHDPNLSGGVVFPVEGCGRVVKPKFWLALSAISAATRLTHFSLSKFNFPNNCSLLLRFNN